MLEISANLHIPADELTWTFARSGGPGGQNVNKVASKALLRWDAASNTTIPAEIKARLRTQQARFFTQEGSVIVSSQRYRDQDRNREDCLAKLRAMILQAAIVPKARKRTRPTRGSQKRRLQEKKRRSDVKQGRRQVGE